MLSSLLLAFADVASSAAPPAATVVTVSASAARANDGGLRLERSIARLNAIRSAAGAPALARSEALALSASAHADYLGEHGRHSAPTIHAETAGLAGFAGADPFVRMRAAGYRPSYATEVIGDGGASASSDADCIDPLMDTIYHAALLLSRVTEVGMAYASGPTAGLCVIDLGAPFPAPAPLRHPAGGIVRYPWPGMTVRQGAYRLASENPRPAPSELSGTTVGIPVLVGLRDAALVTAGSVPPRVDILSFELRDATDTPVPAVVFADATVTGAQVLADEALHGAFVALLPRRPLAPGAYRVFLQATVDAQVVAPPPWTFFVAAP